MKYKAEVARAVAEGLVKLLKPGCRRIEIAGSLRRKKKEVEDIELLCIPKFEEASRDLVGQRPAIRVLAGQEPLPEGAQEARHRPRPQRPAPPDDSRQDRALLENNLGRVFGGSGLRLLR